jgi:hypothetical protein
VLLHRAVLKGHSSSSSSGGGHLRIRPAHHLLLVCYWSAAFVCG